jgi:hypothetical protein
MSGCEGVRLSVAYRVLSPRNVDRISRVLLTEVLTINIEVCWSPARLAIPIRKEVNGALAPLRSTGKFWLRCCCSPTLEHDQSVGQNHQARPAVQHGGRIDRLQLTPPYPASHIVSPHTVKSRNLGDRQSAWWVSVFLLIHRLTLFACVLTLWWSSPQRSKRRRTPWRTRSSPPARRRAERLHPGVVRAVPVRSSVRYLQAVSRTACQFRS